MPQVISGFPGVGKSHLCTLDSRACDSDSSNFSWDPNAVPKRRHLRWPRNYIEHIQGLIMRPEITYILVSSHQEVREAMVAMNIPFLLVYPSPDIKREYIQRFIDRGNAPDFVNLLEVSYETWITGLQAQTGCEHRVIQSGQYLADVLLNPR